MTQSQNTPATNTPASNPATLEVEGLCLEVGHGADTIRLVEEVSFRVESGRTLGLVGESGSGKTVTCMSVPQLLPRGVRLAGGSVRLEGRELTTLGRTELEDVRGQEIGVVFQEPMSSLNPAFTIGDQISSMLRRHQGLSRKQAWAEAVEALALVGIPRPDLRARAYPFEFSGGMSQRAMIAMAIAARPKVLLADEPTTALDVTVQAQILELFRRLQTELNMAMVFVSHDLAVVREVADDIAVMYGGQVVDQGPAERVLGSPSHPYTEGLLRASPQAAQEGGDLYVIPGAPPVLAQAMPGCRFAPRCGYVQPECESGSIPLVQVTGGASRCRRRDELSLQGVPQHV